jgi:ABC-type polysaccharide/polyol phosphate transport system ATPase subunit
MSDIAIRAEGLSKVYRIGERERYHTLRDSLARSFAVPFRSFRNGRQLAEADGASPANDTSRPANRNAHFVWALKDVSLEIKQGEVVGVIGRNGAGKSTLLKILAEITEPTAGWAEVRGRVGSLLEVGTGFHPELTGRENIYLNGAILGMKKAEINHKFDEIVAFAEIDKFLDTPVKHYSSGMYMRLAFSVAAHLEPEILLVDEVLAVGDTAFQKKCLGRMGDVAKRGRTVLFVSHNLAAIAQSCERGLLIDEGRVKKQGRINEVVQEYIGAAPASRSCVEPTAVEHVTGVNGIQVRRVRLVNGLADSFSVLWKEPVHLIIDIEVTKPLHNISFGLGVATLNGVAIFTVHNTDLNSELWSLAPGPYQISVKVHNQLRVGTYNLILGAHEAIAKTSIFYIPDAIRLEVVAPTGAQDLYFEHNAGIVNGNSVWTLSPHLQGASAAVC